MSTKQQTATLTSSSMTSENKRPTKRVTTMTGMIYEANQVLGWAMDPKVGGLHPELFGPSLQGICFINVAEAGFIFSGNVGTGIVLARQPDDGTWSPPSAIGITGLGWGFIMGASMKHLVYLIYDQSTMKAMSGDVGVTLGTKAEAAFGTWGRSAEATNILSNKGIGSDICFHYSQGLMGAFCVEGAVCNPRPKVNREFYRKRDKISPSRILFEKGAVEIPAEARTLINEVYAKLDALCNRNYPYMIQCLEEEKHHDGKKCEKPEAVAATSRRDMTFVYYPPALRSDEGTEDDTAEGDSEATYETETKMSFSYSPPDDSANVSMPAAA